MKEVFVHPKFNVDTLAYNVAVLILDCHVSESKYVKYASYCKWGEPEDDSSVKIGGFGRTVPDSSAPLPTYMQKTTMEKNSNSKCAKLSADYRNIGFPDRSDAYCVLTPKGENDTICGGDSGSAAWQSMDGKQTVVGIASFSRSCDPKYGAGMANICNPELKYFVDFYVGEYCKDEPNLCADCSAPTNKCPLNYYGNPEPYNPPSNITS